MQVQVEREEKGQEDKRALSSPIPLFSETWIQAATVILLRALEETWGSWLRIVIPKMWHVEEKDEEGPVTAFSFPRLSAEPCF